MSDSKELIGQLVADLAPVDRFSWKSEFSSYFANAAAYSLLAAFVLSRFSESQSGIIGWVLVLSWLISAVLIFKGASPGSSGQLILPFHLGVLFLGCLAGLFDLATLVDGVSIGQAIVQSIPTALLSILISVPATLHLLSQLSAVPPRRDLFFSTLIGAGLLTLAVVFYGLGVTPDTHHSGVVFLILGMSLGLLTPFYSKTADRYREKSLVTQSALFPIHAQKWGLSRIALHQPAPLMGGESAGQIAGAKPFRLGEYRGRKIWLMLYRYAGCPFCRQHLYEVSQHVEAIQQAGAQVIAVYESRLSDLAPLDLEAQSAKVLLVSDPEQVIYKQYLAQSHFSALFRMEVFWMFFKAAAIGIFQRKITGRLGRLPTHVLIDEQGKVSDFFYGRHVADQIKWERVEYFLNGPKH